MHIVTISAILAPSLKHLTFWKRINQRDAGWASRWESRFPVSLEKVLAYFLHQTGVNYDHDWLH